MSSCLGVFQDPRLACNQATCLRRLVQDLNSDVTRLIVAHLFQAPLCTGASLPLSGPEKDLKSA